MESICSTRKLIRMQAKRRILRLRLPRQAGAGRMTRSYKLQMSPKALIVVVTFIAGLMMEVTLSAQSQTTRPWMNRNLSPDQRADMVIEQMTLDEKIQLVHGAGWGVLRAGDPVPPRSNLGAGFVPGIDRLGIPDVNMADSTVGVRLGALQSRYSTLLPSNMPARTRSWREPWLAML